MKTELETFSRAAVGDLAVLVGLVALRQAERGGPGRELGVLSVPAPTLEDQARVAARSFRNHEARVAADPTVPHVRVPTTGLYSVAFLQSFSRRWAPLQAENDPHGLNRAHAPNLIAYYTQAAAKVFDALRGECLTLPDQT